MKNFSLYALMVIVIMGCSLIDGSGDDDDDNDFKGCRLASWSLISNWDDGDGFTGSMQQTSTVNYDGNLVDNILSSETEQDCYLGDCDTYSDEFQIVFSYDGNEITGLMMYENGTLVVDGSNLTFENGLLTKVVDLYDGDLDEYRFTYDGSGRLIKEENWDNYTGPTPGELTMFSYTDFVYSGGNMTSSTSYYNDTGIGRLELKRSRLMSSRFGHLSNARPEAFVVAAESTYTYDNMKNPFSDNFALYFMDIPASFAFSDNNVLTETTTYTYGDIPETYTTNFSFTYNDDDYPSQLAMNTPGEQVTASFMYDCK